jgi:hypothetical protein
MGDILGVDLGDLDGSWGGGASLPPVDPKLVHLCDADIGAYRVADLEKGDVENYQDFVEWIEHRRLLCGAARTIPFVTAGSKGGRYNLAVVREYQAKRSKNRDPELVNRVRALRSLLAERDNRTVVGELEEADDLICQYQYAAIRGELRGCNLWPGERTVTDSDDKDLRMFPGLHIDPYTHEHVHVAGFGSCWLDESTSTKKILGWGTSFFWHQLLVGDGADNIPGLPALSGELANHYKPTAAVTKALGRIASGGTERQLTAARRTIQERKPIKVGPVLVATILAGVESDYEALRRVRECYYSYYGAGQFDFEYWKGHTVRKTAGHMLLEQARLLWMRRVPRECPTTFFREVIEAERELEQDVPW